MVIRCSLFLAREEVLVLVVPLGRNYKDETGTRSLSRTRRHEIPPLFSLIFARKQPILRIDKYRVESKISSIHTTT